MAEKHFHRTLSKPQKSGEMKGKGLRYNIGKIRLDLIPASVIEAIGSVLTHGCKKYEDRNWEKGLGWTGVMASLKRHLLAWDRGEDYDPESGLLHIDHILCNATFIREYYQTHPELDDRVLPYLNYKRIGLDVDDVIADFAGRFNEYFGIEKGVEHWNYTYEVQRKWHKLEKSKDFWMGIKPLMDGKKMPFEPVVYISHRPIPVEWMEDWLDLHNFPCVPAVLVKETKDKIPACKEHNVEIFVEDKYENFVMLNKAGICTYLWDRSFNRKYNVGYRRITDLKQLL